MSNSRYFMYLRKSSESSDRQVASIPAQERELMELAKRRGLVIVGSPIKEEMSAKKPGRPKFNRMLEDLQKKRAEGILCWHLDRLARNPLDGGRLMQALGDGVIQEFVTPGRSYTNADDKLMMAIEFGMSTKFIDDLRRNVARGRRQALESGRWPSSAKLGYVRDHEHKTFIPDPQRFELVRELFLLCLQRVPVAEILRRAREEWGLTTPRRKRVGGKLLSQSRLYAILHDPFYAGVMSFNGQTYRCSYPTMITWTEFEEVQSSLKKGKTHTPKTIRHNFAYRGLISCGSCGALVTAEYTTNRHGKRYTHYHCCRKSRVYGYCPEGSLEETALERELEIFLKSLVLPEEIAQLIETVLPTLEGTLAQTTSESCDRLRQQLADKEKQLHRLRELCVREVITEADYITDKEKVLNEQRTLEDSIRELENREGLIEPLKQGFSFVNQAVASFRHGTPEEKRLIIQAVSSNLTLTSRKLTVQAKEPFGLFMKLREIPDVQANQEHLRTLILETAERIRNQNSMDDLELSSRPG